MAAYIIADVTITDAAEYEAYKKLTPGSVAAFNGKFIVRGGQTVTLEGDWQPGRIVVLEFPSMEIARQWWTSDQYGIAKLIRQRAATTKMIAVDGV